jgi:hypothetical protein
MALFAEINENNKVVQTIVISDNDCGGGVFPDSESIGKAFIVSLGLGENWLQYSPDNPYHKNCSVGSFYITDGKFFTLPQPYLSWTMDANYEWQPPVPKPSEDGYWDWNEAEQKWQR